MAEYHDVQTTPDVHHASGNGDQDSVSQTPGSGDPESVIHGTKVIVDGLNGGAQECE